MRLVESNHQSVEKTIAFERWPLSVHAVISLREITNGFRVAGPPVFLLPIFAFTTKPDCIVVNMYNMFEATSPLETVQRGFCWA